VPGDFMSAVTETITEEALSRAPLAIVEGQGSLIHPAYSAVALGILHGCCPDAMVLCHQPSRTEIEEYGVEIPPLDELVGVYERAAALVYPSRVVAVALNTFDLDEASAERQAAEAGARTGLPVTDVMAQTIQASEIGPDIIYHLGSNPKEAERISKLTPFLQAKEIGRIEAKLADSPPVKKTTSAPAPIAPVTPRGATARVVDTTDPRSIKSMSTSEWIEAERQRQIKRWEAQTKFR